MINASGGKPQRISTDPANDGDPSWSGDGRWIYFDSGRTGEQQVWKIPEAGGDAIQVTQDGGFAPKLGGQAFGGSPWRVVRPPKCLKI